MHHISPLDSEKVALRLLLANCPARTWEDLRTAERAIFETLHEAARRKGLILDQHDEIRTAIQLAHGKHRLMTELRLLAALGVEMGANLNELIREFHGTLGD
jgi:hypothetical protein